jgi:hypothetical protein
VRRERFLVAAVAILLILFRSVVPTLFEGFYFDSDQAIVGLMARHLSAFHGFPLYYYGLNYLLGVQAWIIAPFFWLFRSSVAVMRLPLIALNAVVAVWLIVALERRLALRPAIALVAALPFIAPTPALGGQLLEAAGASIEPFVYVLALWTLRRRPFLFGCVLTIGFLHREFTIFALPALVLGELTQGTPWRRLLRLAPRAAAGAALVWLIIDDLKLRLGGGAVGLQVVSLGSQMCGGLHSLALRVDALLTQALPALFGGRPTRLDAFRMNTPMVGGSTIVGWLVLLTLATMVVRTIVASRSADDGRETGFGVYLAAVGAFAACAYPLSCNVALGAPPLLRYLLLAVLLPVGCAALFFSRETSAAMRRLGVAAFLVWGAANLADTARLVRMSVADPPSNEHRALADYLVAHRIRYARAIYWDAYVVDFLSRERVIVAAVDVERIPAYRKAVDEHADRAVNLVRLPCAGAERIASWCIQKE